MAQRLDETAPTFPIGLMARRTGLSPEGIRFYEAEGLLPAPARSEGRRRLYSPAHLKRLAFIRRARDLGFTLDEVRALLRLAESSRDTCADARNMAADHLNDVRAKIADLRAMERVLSKTVSECDAGTRTQCPLIEALSRTSNSRIRKS
jgi:MerR family mercuric resistance operon transcriptional regulator